MKLQEGKRYVRRDGEVTVALKRNPHPVFCFKTNILTYTEDGVCDHSNTNLDIVAEYEKGPSMQDTTSITADVQVSHKKTLNFWEAREAALTGKKVRIVNSTLEWAKCDFAKHYCVTKNTIEADWEIVEEPVQKTHYYSVFAKEDGDIELGMGWCSKQQANSGRPDKIGTIAITLDKNGKLVKAESV